MLEGANDTKQTRKCDKIAWQKSETPKGLDDFLSRLLWSLVRSDKILSRRNTPVALVYNTRWQIFLKSKQKFCLVRPAHSIAKLFTWSTANKGILTNRCILFVNVEGKHKFTLIFGYMYGICQLAKIFDRGLKNIAVFSSARSQSLATRTDTKPVNNLVIVSTLPLSNHFVVERFRAHVASSSLWPWSEIWNFGPP